MSAPIKELCLVHLVRAHNGTEPFRRFLDSYRDNPGGIEHDLLIIFKGFERPEHAEEYRKLLAPFPHLSLEISDEGFDITAYFKAFEHYSGQYRYFCFLNSFSVILDPEWLSKLYQQIVEPEVGLVGASGSWQSLNPWGKILKRMKMRSRIINISTPTQQTGYLKTLWYNVSVLAIAIGRLSSFPFFFPTFPNYHLRTNAFMISSNILEKIILPTLNTKIDAYRFESGKNGLTRQVLGMGKQVLVVGKDGIGYDMASWNRSGTFWQSEQENLLVADNQTRDYRDGTMDARRYMSFNAWRTRDKISPDTTD